MSEDDEENQKLIEEFRNNNGKVGGYFSDKNLLLLHTKGVKSGLERVTPAAYVRDGEHFAIIASNSGAPNHPAWYHNLMANPLVTVEVGSETIQVRTEVAKEPEQTLLFDKMVKMMPIFEKYRREATRMIPVVILIAVNRLE